MSADCLRSGGSWRVWRPACWPASRHTPIPSDPPWSTAPLSLPVPTQARSTSPTRRTRSSTGRASRLTPRRSRASSSRRPRARCSIGSPAPTLRRSSASSCRTGACFSSIRTASSSARVRWSTPRGWWPRRWESVTRTSWPGATGSMPAPMRGTSPTGVRSRQGRTVCSCSLRTSRTAASSGPTAGIWCSRPDARSR